MNGILRLVAVKALPGPRRIRVDAGRRGIIRGGVIHNVATPVGNGLLEVAAPLPYGCARYARAAVGARCALFEIVCNAVTFLGSIGGCITRRIADEL